MPVHLFRQDGDMISRVELVQGRSLATATGVAVMLVGALVLTGWTTGYLPLTSVVPGWPAMVPASALALILCSASLLLLALPSDKTSVAAQRRCVMASGLCAAIAVLIGALRLVELATAAQWNVRFLGGAPQPSGIMTAATATNLMLLGTALLLTARTRLPLLAQALAVLVMLIAWLGLSGYVFGGQLLQAYTGMALHTALSFGLLGAGVLALGGHVGLVKLLANAGTVAD
jgi:hypothetical protein